jgi:transcriptional regulator with XRE-family HTH domain
MKPAQCKMARAGLGLGVRELADLAKVSTNTITRFEAGDELKPRTVEAIQRALEAAGVEFTNGNAPGVKLLRESRDSK